MFKNILVPTDGSPLSERCAAAAVTLAKTSGARITALYCMPPATPIMFDHLLPVAHVAPDEHARLIEKAADKYVGAIGQMAQDAGVEVEQVKVVSDFPAQTIIETAAARGCDLIFMASHGRRGLSAVLIGSETQKVLAHAQGPVLVYR